MKMTENKEEQAFKILRAMKRNLEGKEGELWGVKGTWRQVEIYVTFTNKKTKKKRIVKI